MTRLLYGVQATGNGHITRARVMAPKLKKAGFDVTFLFTGRPREDLFEMDDFGDYLCRQGLTFVTGNGKVHYVRTAFKTNIIRFIRDVNALDLSPYNLIINDFEPVSAWAAKLRKKKVIGVGHQYAFNHPIPITGDDIIARLVMRNFAPADIGLGLHWHHFSQPILPPIIEVPPSSKKIMGSKIIVYLPFEEPAKVIQLLTSHTQFDFHIFTHRSAELKDTDHIYIHPISRVGFQQHFRDAAGIICNSGFELSSEALQMGKKLLVKPLHAQMEQLSNALALEQLKYAHVMHELEADAIERWLDYGDSVQITFPDTAQAIVDWLAGDSFEVERRWIDGLWDKVKYCRTISKNKAA